MILFEAFLATYNVSVSALHMSLFWPFRHPHMKQLIVVQASRVILELYGQISQ